jgi:hypothetical protein
MDENYFAWERNYKVEAHRSWNAMLNHGEFAALLRAGEYEEVAMRALRIELCTNLNLLVRKNGAARRRQVEGWRADIRQRVYDLIYSKSRDKEKFDRWCVVVGSLPHRKTRVLTRPIATVFGFIALPRFRFFYNPTVTRAAAQACGYPIRYNSRPSWESYKQVLEFARVVRRDLSALRPRDMIDIQSFLWVQSSAEYPG